MTLDFTARVAIATGAVVRGRRAAARARVSHRTGEQVPASGAAQGSSELSQALVARH